MSKNHSSSNGDGTSSKTESNNIHHNTPKGDTIQSDRYTFNDSDKGKSNAPKTHEYSGRTSNGTTYEGGHGENYNSSGK